MFFNAYIKYKSSIILSGMPFSYWLLDAVTIYFGVDSEYWLVLKKMKVASLRFRRVYEEDYMYYNVLDDW